MIELEAKVMKIESLLSPPAKRAEVVSSVGIGTMEESKPFRKSPIIPYFRKKGF
jgi:hypothetical protein